MEYLLGKNEHAWLLWHCLLDVVCARPPAYVFTSMPPGSSGLFLLQGVRADHIEFGYQNGAPGSRVQADWGFLGALAQLRVPSRAPKMCVLTGLNVVHYTSCALRL